MNSIETINVASVPAFTIQYTGTGTGTLTHAAHVITMARANVEAFTLTYTGSAATCTVAQDADTLTIARSGVDAFTLGYTGSGSCYYSISDDTFNYYRTDVDAFTLEYTGEGTCTVTVADGTLTITRGEVPTAYTLADAANDTITELVAVLNAVDDLTCTIGADANGSLGTGDVLQALEATDITSALVLKYDDLEDTSYDLTNELYNTASEFVAVLNAIAYFTCTIATECASAQVTTALTDASDVEVTSAGVIVKYTPSDVTFDLANASYNTLAEIIAALNALPYLTCTIATGALATDDAGLLDTLEAASIKTAKTLTYTYADVTLDTTNASYNTVTEVIEALDALNGVVTSAETTTFLNSDAITINEFEAANIATAKDITIDTGEVTAAFMPLGTEIRVEGTQYLAIYATVDINSSQNMRLKATARLESGGTDYVIDHSQILYSRDAVATDKSYIEIANDEDQYLMWLIPVYGYSHIQLWLSAETVGATAGQIDALSYQNIKGVPL
jgi:hypothetical protein